jgi:hypothetical protein
MLVNVSLTFEPQQVRLNKKSTVYLVHLFVGKILIHSKCQRAASPVASKSFSRQRRRRSRHLVNAIVW